MSNVIPFDLTHGVHICDKGCFAWRACDAYKNATDPAEKAILAAKLEDAMGMGPTDCQLVGFIGKAPFDE